MLEKECKKYPWPPSCSFIPDEDGQKLCEKCKKFDKTSEDKGSFPEMPFEEATGSMTSEECKKYSFPPDCSFIPNSEARKICEKCKAFETKKEKAEGSLEISPGVYYISPPKYGFPVVLYDSISLVNERDSFYNENPANLRKLGFNTMGLLIEYYWDYDTSSLHLNLGGRWVDDESYKQQIMAFVKQANYYGFNAMVAVSTIACRVSKTDQSGRGAGCYPVQFPCSQFSSSVPKPDKKMCRAYSEQLKQINLEWLKFAGENKVEYFSLGEFDTPFANKDDEYYVNVGVESLKELIKEANKVYNGTLTVGLTRNYFGDYEFDGVDILGISFYPKGSNQEMLNEWNQYYKRFSELAERDSLPNNIFITETFLANKPAYWMSDFAGGSANIKAYTDEEIASYYDELIAKNKGRMFGIAYTWLQEGTGMKNLPELQAVWKKHFGNDEAKINPSHKGQRCCFISYRGCNPGEQQNICCIGENCPPETECEPGIKPCCDRFSERCY